MSADRVNELRYVLGQTTAPHMPAASPSSHREPIASVSGGPLGSTELDTVDIAVVVDEDTDFALPPLVTVTVWDGTSGIAATAALPIPAARKVLAALGAAIDRGEQIDQRERQE